MLHEAIEKHLAGVTQTDTVGRLVEGADEDQTPEAIDGARRLLVPIEPILKRWIALAFALQTRQAPRDPQLFRDREVMGAQEAARQMKRRRPAIAVKATEPPIRRHEIQACL